MARSPIRPLILDYAQGVADGHACRRQGGSPSPYRLIARNDDYSAGFRAGFFERALERPRLRAVNK